MSHFPSRICFLFVFSFLFTYQSFNYTSSFLLDIRSLVDIKFQIVMDFINLSWFFSFSDILPMNTEFIDCYVHSFDNSFCVIYIIFHSSLHNRTITILSRYFHGYYPSHLPRWLLQFHSHHNSFLSLFVSSVLDNRSTLYYCDLTRYIPYAICLLSCFISILVIHSLFLIKSVCKLSICSLNSNIPVSFQILWLILDRTCCKIS